MDTKLIFAIIATIIGILASFPYVRDIILKKTRPHSFTWLIWAVTQGTATVALWYGDAGFGIISPIVGTCSIILIFFLSLRYGEKNITRSDIMIFIIAVFAILIWWLTNNPLLSLILVCFIDLIAYIPTFRKSYNHPWTETILAWIASIIANVFAILALSKYNVLTLSYLITILLSNAAFILFLLARRRKIPRTIHNRIKI